MKNKQLSFIVLVLLALFVLVSKEIIIFNDEMVVVGCFVAFMVFLYRAASDIIVGELEDRAIQIQKEFDQFFTLKEQILALLISYHKKQSTLFQDITDILNFSKSEIKGIISKRQLELEGNIAQQINNKLKNVANKEAALLESVQQKTSKFFAESIQNQFKSNEVTELSKNVLVNESINLIKQIALSRFNITEASQATLDKVVVLQKATGLPVNIIISGLLLSQK